jgi:arylsulfatase A-like enzyme
MKRSPDSPPNVLLIVFDDLNTNTGFFGDHAARTPHLDRFSKRATTFTNAHCAIAVCNPSRAALLTGQPPWVTGVWSQAHDWLRECCPDAMTIPQYFKQSGYQSVGTGKVFDSAKPDPQSWDRYLFWDPAAETHQGIERYYDPPTPLPSKRPVTRYADGSEELYHIANDPHELENLAHYESHAATKSRLREQLNQQLTRHP